jgi:hypothetical protein
VSAAAAAELGTDGTRLQRVIRPGAKKRSALVLSTSAHEHRFMPADEVAAFLDAMPHYQGQVALLQNLKTTDEPAAVSIWAGKVTCRRTRRCGSRRS